MKVAYVEMVGGAAGNMLAGAFVDLGVPLEYLESQLRTIPVHGWRIETTRVVKRGIAATYLDVIVPGEDPSHEHEHHEHEHGHHHHGHEHEHEHHHEGRPTRHLSDVLEIVERSGLSPRVKQQAGAVYRRLAEAEARVHGTTAEEIHFHEVGQVDAIVDVALTCVALEQLGVERLYCSDAPVGRGEIDMAHGRFPNPPPATLELLRGIALRPVEVRGELVTTTAAAILGTLAVHPGERPAMRVEAIGYGAGSSDFPIPNVTRICVGELLEQTPGGEAFERDEVMVLEANVDDMDPRWFEGAFDALLAAGANDVWLTPVQMKKSRPAVIVGAVCQVEHADAVARALLEHTTTLGVRMRKQERAILPRRIQSIATPHGSVRVKLSRLPGGRERRTVEYDDVRAIATARGVPIEAVVRELEVRLEEWS
ncbi:nickel pincer cofactor biosynthesis protein LarC [bacterium]|nr:MAG: nickel pincer cofactor biosynthesis protein LarC [bacterium]